MSYEFDDEKYTGLLYLAVLRLPSRREASHVYQCCKLINYEGFYNFLESCRIESSGSKSWSWPLKAEGSNFGEV